MLRQVASGFQMAALVMGVPSLAAVLFFGGSAIFLRMNTPVESPGGHAGPSLVNYLVDGARLLGKIFGFLGLVGQTVFAVLAGVAFLVLLFAVLCFFTGRGLQENAMWARVVAMGISGVVLLIAAFGILSTRRVPGLIFFGPFAAASGYALWALLRRG